MKHLFSLLTLLLSVSAMSQKLSFPDSLAINQLDWSKIVTLNGAKSENVTLEKGMNYLIDFSSMDLPAVDSMVVETSKRRWKNSEIRPILIEKAQGKISIYRFHGGDTIAFVSSKESFSSFSFQKEDKPVFTNDVIVFGLLALVLALIFYSSALKGKFWKKFYMFVPALLLCYLIPALLDLFGIISAEHSKLYDMAKNYMLPGALLLMTLGIDFKAIISLGPKALIMLLTATLGIIVGGPVAILIYKQIDPAVVGGEGFDAAWRGFATLAGSWIGGGANQAAMLETYGYNQALYGKMVTVDIIVANMWMAFLLWAAARADKLDKWLKADATAIHELKTHMDDYHESIARKASLVDYMMILGFTFGIVGLAHLSSGWLADGCAALWGSESPFASAFLWLVVVATTGGMVLSATKLRAYEGAGASKLGSVFIYILVATIGMKMDLGKALEEPQLILVGIIWMLVHVGILLFVAKLIRAPFFFVAVGSQANVGGAASAPVVAAAFHPSLAAVGAILAVLGYALGTYGAILCAELMQGVAP